MAEHLYKVVEIIGSSPDSFEKAAKAAVEAAGEHLKDLRVAEVDGYAGI
jgi:flavin-binding protein dodecin